MKRRSFIHLSATACVALGIPFYACSPKDGTPTQVPSDFEQLVAALLEEWADALLAVQVNYPDNVELHGALYCPACDKIHGRCMDAVYPFMYMADKTGEQKYLDAAISVMEWSKNVSRPDGSWTVIPNPKSWRGITVFGAIALGEALHHHGHILPENVKEQWTDRLSQAADFIYQNFTMTYSHVNYAFTAVYALNFLGRILENPAYVERSRELANEVPNWLTEPNKLIFGEDHPADKRSAKGLLPVDLGYNVEETLNALVQYAVLENDEALLQLLTESMEGHLEFMLPDGAWDNSFGTRQNKWSYWGSRTTDGCQPAFGLMAARNPAFGTAAYRSTELLQRCTVDGLLAGGLHYGSHGVLPCVHHTFAHAKSLAFILDNAEKLPPINKAQPLPRSTADGVKHFPELDVWLAARGPWKATISSYDNEFKKEHSQQATGGSLALLWHDTVGPIFTASMAKYLLVEKNNQQPQPGEEFALTPRLEIFENGKWYTNLYDLPAQVDFSDVEEVIQFDVQAALLDENREPASGKKATSGMTYIIDHKSFTIKIPSIYLQGINHSASLVLPVISPTGEPINQPSPNTIEIQKPEALVIIEANVPLQMKRMSGERIFNMVPGMEVVPIIVHSESTEPVICKIRVKQEVR